MRKIRGFLVFVAAAVICLSGAQAQNSGQLAPDPAMGVPSASSIPGTGQSSATGTAPTPNAGVSTSTDSSGSHIIVKPKLNIESDKDPMNDDEALLQLIASMPEGVQKDLMDEAAYVKGYCDYNAFLNSYYDCSCFSLRIISDRIAKGPKVPVFSLMQNGRYSKCVDDSKVAGIAYQQCMAIITALPVNTQQLNDTCECAGRTMASSYLQSPEPNVSQVNRMFTDVLTYCRHKAGF